MSRLVDLYPRTWRQRYGDELLALLAERPPSVRDRLDLVRGALDARRHPQLPGTRQPRDRVGLAPLAGLASLAIAVVLAANGPVHVDEHGSYRDGVAALPFLALALITLSIGLYRVVDRLPPDADGARGAGLVAIVAGPIWALMPWMVLIGLVFLLGMAGLAVGARRAGLWPAWSVVLTVAAVAVPAGLFAAVPFLPWYAFRESGLTFLVVVGPISVLWPLTGGLLLRGLPQRV
jgi:hypothetical protein